MTERRKHDWSLRIYTSKAKQQKSGKMLKKGELVKIYTEALFCLRILFVYLFSETEFIYRFVALS